MKDDDSNEKAKLAEMLSSHHAMRQALEYPGPRSVCECGHTGDGPESQHANKTYGKGDGAHTVHGDAHCEVAGCACDKFSWAGWTDEFDRARRGEAN